MERLTVEAMSFGPYGIAHRDGKTWMVPNVAPGDELEVETEAQRRDYTIAHLRHLIKPGPNRRETPCIYLPRCGGCDWQQLDYPAQLRIKGELLAAEFKRGFGIELDPRGLIEPAPAEFGYRSRIRVKVASGDRVGYRELAGAEIVPIEQCLVSSVPLAGALQLAQTLKRRCDEIEIVAAASDSVLIADLGRSLTDRDRSSASKLIQSRTDIRGIILRANGERALIGDVTAAIEPEPGCRLTAEADCFSQVNHAQNQKLVSAVMALARIKPGTPVLDLFCGIGNFAIPAARRGADVTGVDSDERAITAARANALTMGLQKTQFIAMNAAETARFLRRAHYQPAIVMLDPPRTGALALMEPLARLRAPRLIYISCDLTTLVRDLKQLVAHDYQIGAIRGFDLFPNTHHLEVVAEVLLT